MENAISADGSKVFWTAGPGSGAPGLYVWIDGTSTAQVDASQGGSGSGGGGEYWDAATDGSKVIFTDGNRAAPPTRRPQAVLTSTSTTWTRAR